MYTKIYRKKFIEIRKSITSHWTLIVIVLSGLVVLIHTDRMSTMDSALELFLM